MLHMIDRKYEQLTLQIGPAWSFEPGIKMFPYCLGKCNSYITGKRTTNHSDDTFIIK